MKIRSFFRLPVVATGRRSAARVGTGTIGVLRPAGAILRTRTTFTSTVATTTRIGTTATAVDRFALLQNKSETC